MRTCKAVYFEAEQVLYGFNNFTVSVNFELEESTWDNGGDLGVCNHHHYISIARPGHSEPYVFFRDNPADQFEALREHMASSSCFDMLRRVRRLDVFISNCTASAREIIAVLCMMLSGRARIKIVNIVLQPSHAAFDKKEHAKVLWPLVLVNAQVKFGLKMQDAALRDKMKKAIKGSKPEAEAYWRLLFSYPHQGVDAPGDLISRARARASYLTKRHNKDCGYLRVVDFIMSEIMMYLVDIEDYDGGEPYFQACKVVQCYIYEDDQILRSLEKMAKDDLQTFPTRYANCRRHGMLTGGWAWQMGIGGWS
jgi:hypothetical protein